MTRPLRIEYPGAHYHITSLLSFPSGKVDKQIEAQILEMLALLRGFEKKKQTMLLSAIKGLISGIEKI